VLSLTIFIFLWRIRRHDHRVGWLFFLYLMLAGMERLFVELFRAKDDRFFGVFTLAQLISVLLIISGAVGVWAFRQRRVREPAT
jgi:phosphatidylglycerol:prolipoprotein diacylglycerol transferase